MMKNTIRVKQYMADKLADFLDQLNNEIGYVETEKEETEKQLESEPDQSYYKNQLERCIMKLEGYTDLYKKMTSLM